MKYTAPKAELISFETISVIMNSDPWGDDSLPEIGFMSNGDTSNANVDWD